MKTIHRRLRRIEAINGRLRNLIHERSQCVRPILDTMPVQEGDEFSYMDDLSGVVVAAWVGYDMENDTAHIRMTYKNEDGKPETIFDVNPKLLRRAEKRRKNGKAIMDSEG